jgi:hypothetical protein
MRLLHVIRAILPGLLLAASSARADFAVFTQDANVYQDASSASSVLARVHADDAAELVSRRSEHGYFLVRFGDDEADIGYVYRTHLRLRTGDPGFVSRRSDGRSASEVPDGADVTPRGRGSGIEPDGAFNGCPLIGNVSPKAPNHDELVALNRNKNRYDSPNEGSIDPAVTLESMLAPGDDTDRFRVGQAVRLSGYVHDVKTGGVETCNCKARAQTERDTHIELVLGADDGGPGRRVIVEVTPRMRALMAQRGQDWSTATLQKTIIGRTITVTGWMLFDEEHKNQAENTAPGNPSNWRATVWEVHPITAIGVGATSIAMQ